MDSTIETLNRWGGNLPGFAWPMLWQSSLLIAALLAFDFLFRRKLRASIRYALWLVVLVKLCVPPTLALPTSPTWWLHQAPPPVVAKPPLPHYTVTYDQGPLLELPQTPLPAYEPPKPVMTKTAWLLVICASGSVVLLVWMLVRWWQIARLVRRATATAEFSEVLTDALHLAGAPVSDPACSSLIVKRAGSETGAPTVRLKIVEGQMSPAVCGLFRPVILLPRSLAERLSAGQLRAVLLHELIHLRRCDVWLNFLQTLLQIAYWWHPLVWVANARIRRVREEAVDDAVMLALRDEAETYAPTLLEVAKLALNRPLATLGLVGILESRSALRQRIERLVDFHPPRKAGLTLVSLLGILAFTAVAVPMGEGPAPVEKPSLPVSSASMSAAALQTTNAYPTNIAGNHVGTITGILTDPNFRMVIHALEQRSGVEYLAEPEVTTRSGRGVNSMTMAKISVPFSNTNAERLVQEGKLHFEMGNFAEANAKLNQALMVDSNNAVAKYYLGLAKTNEAVAKTLAYSGLGRQGIVKKLHEIRLDHVEFNAVPLADVLRNLSQQAKSNDPEKKGINFLINPHPDQSGPPVAAPTIDPVTGLPMAQTTGASSMEEVDLGSFAIKTSRLNDVTLGEVLDAVVKGASEPIHYSIQDFAVVFSPGKAPQPLFSRVFAVNVQSLAAGMKQVGVNLAGQTNSTAQIMLAFRRYVSGLGVEWEAPPGKTIFYSDGKERLMVKATEGDLNIIEHAIDKLLPPPPQIHIKARFVEVPKGTTSAFGQFPGPTNSPNGGFTGILSSTNARVMLRALESRNDVEFIAEPECTTLGGRQTQMRATEQIDVITGVSFEQQVEMPGVVVTNGVSFKTEKVEVGPILDVVPNVLADGHTINLTVIPSVTEFLGYEETTNMTPSVAATGQGMKYPSMRPSFRVRQFPANVNLWNGQTLILGGLPEKYITAGEEVNDKSKRSDKELLIFITATIVDPAGNRVHNEKDGYFDPMGIPPQPVSK